MASIDLTWLETLRWPLVLVLLAIGLYFWRRAPERREPWEPPEPPREAPPADPDAPAEPVRREVGTSALRDETTEQPEGGPGVANRPD